MSSDAVPAAVPGPNEAAGAPTSSTPQEEPKRLLESMLAATEPARPATFNLDPDTAADTATTIVDNGSSSDYHRIENPQNGDQKNTGNSDGNAQHGVIRAWLLAGAERWRKGGDARLKALDAKVARARAMQVKESRTVNRSEKIVGGSSNTGTNSQNNASKSLDNKIRNDSPVKSPRNQPGAVRNDPAGKGGQQTRSATGPSTGGHKPTQQPGKTPAGPVKNNPAPAPKAAPSGATSAGKPGPQGPAGKPGKEPHGAAKASKTAGSPDGGTGKRWSLRKADPQTPAKKTDKSSPAGADHNVKKNKTGPQPAAKGSDTGASSSKKPGKSTDTQSSKKGDAPAAAKTGPKANEAPGKDAGKPWTTQGSREAGYRDGTRAARITAQAQAYRDGVKDGYRDVTDAAKREKDRLDKAHARRKHEREDRPVTGQTSSADYHQPQPITVTGADASGIHLGDGATRPSMSRGEVRSFIGFQKKLDGRTDVMTRSADRSKAYEAHAAAQTKKISNLLEQAQGMKGGEKVVEKLTKLEEASKAQEEKAREVHRRAMRGAEGCQALSANADTRYGDIVRAAADSTDGPAELAYYRDMGVTTNA